MAIKERCEEFDWSTEDEIQLFFALDGLHPMGVNKHFAMAILVERLNGPFKLSREITSEAIWAKLKSMYNMDKLDELEEFPIEHETFSLPESFTPKSSEEELEPKIEPKTTELKTIVREEKRNSTPSRDSEASKRTLPKRTRGSTSLETSGSSPSTPTLPKRRRI